MLYPMDNTWQADIKQQQCMQVRMETFQVKLNQETGEHLT